MRRILGVALAGLSAMAQVCVGAERDYGVRSLSGLSAVRVEVLSPEGVDSVDAEVALLLRLRAAGLAVAADAPAVLQADVRAGADVASAELTLTQAVCLERDPVLSERVATWFQGTAVRGDRGGEPGGMAVAGLASLVDEFVGDWRRANGGH